MSLPSPPRSLFPINPRLDLTRTNHTLLCAVPRFPSAPGATPQVLLSPHSVIAPGSPSTVPSATPVSSTSSSAPPSREPCPGDPTPHLPAPLESKASWEPSPEQGWASSLHSWVALVAGEGALAPHCLYEVTTSVNTTSSDCTTQHLALPLDNTASPSDPTSELLAGRRSPTSPYLASAMHVTFQTEILSVHSCCKHQALPVTTPPPSQ